MGPSQSLYRHRKKRTYVHVLSGVRTRDSSVRTVQDNVFSGMSTVHIAVDITSNNNVKLSLRLRKYHTMEAGGGTAARILHLGTRCR